MASANRRGDRSRSEVWPARSGIEPSQPAGRERCFLRLRGRIGRDTSLRRQKYRGYWIGPADGLVEHQDEVYVLLQLEAENRMPRPMSWGVMEAASAVLRQWWHRTCGGAGTLPPVSEKWRQQYEIEANKRGHDL